MATNRVFPACLLWTCKIASSYAVTVRYRDGNESRIYYCQAHMGPMVDSNLRMGLAESVTVRFANETDMVNA